MRTHGRWVGSRLLRAPAGTPAACCPDGYKIVAAATLEQRPDAGAGGSGDAPAPVPPAEAASNCPDNGTVHAGAGGSGNAQAPVPPAEAAINCPENAAVAAGGSGGAAAATPGPTAKAVINSPDNGTVSAGGGRGAAATPVPSTKAVAINCPCTGVVNAPIGATASLEQLLQDGAGGDAPAAVPLAKASVPTAAAPVPAPNARTSCPGNDAVWGASQHDAAAAISVPAAVSWAPGNGVQLGPPQHHGGAAAAPAHVTAATTSQPVSALQYGAPLPAGEATISQPVLAPQHSAAAAPVPAGKATPYPSTSCRGNGADLGASQHTGAAAAPAPTVPEAATSPAKPGTGDVAPVAEAAPASPAAPAANLAKPAAAPAPPVAEVPTSLAEYGTGDIVPVVEAAASPASPAAAPAHVGGSSVATSAACASGRGGRQASSAAGDKLPELAPAAAQTGGIVSQYEPPSPPASHAPPVCQSHCESHCDSDCDAAVGAKRASSSCEQQPLGKLQRTDQGVKPASFKPLGTSTSRSDRAGASVTQGSGTAAAGWDGVGSMYNSVASHSVAPCDTTGTSTAQPKVHPRLHRAARHSALDGKERTVGERNVGVASVQAGGRYSSPEVNERNVGVGNVGAASAQARGSGVQPGPVPNWGTAQAWHRSQAVSGAPQFTGAKVAKGGKAPGGPGRGVRFAAGGISGKAKAKPLVLQPQRSVLQAESRDRFMAEPLVCRPGHGA